MKTLVGAVLTLGLLVADAGTFADVQAQSAPVKLTMVGAWKPKVSPAADIGIKFKDTDRKSVV